MNCELHSNFDGVSFDPRIVRAKIRLSLRRNMARTTTIVRYDWSLLNKRDIKENYMLLLRKKFDIQQKSEIYTPNDEYENLANAHQETAAECIPIKQRSKQRVALETIVVGTKRANVKTASKYNRRNPTNINAPKLKKCTKGIN